MTNYTRLLVEDIVDTCFDDELFRGLLVSVALKQANPKEIVEYFEHRLAIRREQLKYDGVDLYE